MGERGDIDPHPANGNVVTFPQSRRPNTYSARPFKVATETGYAISMSGELEGLIDFAIATNQGSLTYLLSCDDARRIIAALHSTIADI